MPKNRRLQSFALATLSMVAPFQLLTGKAHAMESLPSYEQINAQVTDILNREVGTGGQKYKDTLASKELLRQRDIHGNLITSLKPRCEADCWFGIGAWEDPGLYYASSIAGKIQLLEYIFLLRGIPGRVWSPYLEQLRVLGESGYKRVTSLEQSAGKGPNNAIASFYAEDGRKQDAIIVKLTNELNAYLTKHFESLPTGTWAAASIDMSLYGNSMIGSGMLYPLRLRVVPSGGSLSIIPTFRYMLCKARGIDPENQAKCTGWRLNPTEEVANYLAGEYYYQAYWSNERVKRSGRIIVIPPQDSITIKAE